MAYAATKERAHELIDRMEPGKVSNAVDLLEKMVAPQLRSPAEIPFEDEEIGEDEEAAVARAKADPRPGTSMAELLVELGFTQADLDAVDDTPLELQSDIRR